MKSDRTMTAGALTRGAYFAAYAVLPVFATFSGGTATTFLAIAVILLLAEALRGRDAMGELRAIGAAIPSNPPLILALIFVALAWLSLAWSRWPEETVLFSTHMTGILALSVLWYRYSRAQDLPWAERMIILGAVTAAVVVLLGIYGILNLRAMLIAHHYISMYNRGILITCMFAATLVALAIGGRGRARLYVAWAIFALGAITAFSSGSETSKLFALAFPLLLVMYLLAGRLAAWLPALLPPLIYFAFPLIVGPLRLPLEAAKDGWLKQLIIASSALARREIWATFLEAAMQRPILGWGFGTERFVPLPGQVMAANGMGPWTHPHSLPVQVLVNLGLTGFIIAGGAIAAASLAISRLAPASRAPALALLTAVLAAGSISHGAWQDWWLSAVALTMAPLFIQAKAARD